MKNTLLQENIALQARIAELEKQNVVLAQSNQDLTQSEQELSQKVEDFSLQVQRLTEQVRILKALQYAKKSEKRIHETSGQLSLFDFMEGYVKNEATPVEETVEVVEVIETITVPEHTRKKRGRKAIPDIFPRVDVIHDLPDEEKVCACGCQLSRIGEEISEKLDIVPQKIQVIRHIRPKYACNSLLKKSIFKSFID